MNISVGFVPVSGRLLVIAAALLTTSGCAGAPKLQPTAETTSFPVAPRHAMGLGSPGRPAVATTEVLVRTLDSFKFKPAKLTVASGETVHFVVRNDGDSTHEFVLGDATYQDRVRNAGGVTVSAPNAVSVGPGATKDLTWRFSNSGNFLFACQEPGHYDSGMVGTITVKP